MNIIQVPLTQILPNPYQPRDGEDPEHIEKIAHSIFQEGLLQAPVGRVVDALGARVATLGDVGMHADLLVFIEQNNCKIQLAFGHSRLAAFKFLDDRENKGFEAMPVSVRDISDEEMFRLGISENLARKDLTPIEEAKAMLVYRERFKKTSGEIGKLFGIGESAVRNKLRLLDLPEAARQKLDQGEITEGTARQLLTLQVVADPKKVEEMAEKLANGGYETPEKIKQEITYSMQANSKEMWGSYYTNEGEPRGGAGLWPLNWIPDFEMCLNVEALKKVLQKDWEEHVKDRKKLEIYYQQMWDGNDLQKTAEQFDVPAGFLELVNVLIHKTPCTGCPFYARLDGKHFCGQEACWKAKREIWFYHELREVSEKMGIPIYDSEKDGKEILTIRMEDWKILKREDWGQWVKAKHSGLRLKAHYEEYSENSHTKSHTVELVMTGKTAIQKKQAMKENKEKESERSGNSNREYEENRKRQEATLKFIQAAAAPVFASLLEEIQNLAFLEWKLARHDSLDALPKNRAERMNVLRRLLMDRWLRDWLPWGEASKGPSAVAQHLQGLATTLGLELPADWLELAAKFEPGVSVETE